LYFKLENILYAFYLYLRNRFLDSSFWFTWACPCIRSKDSKCGYSRDLRFYSCMEKSL